MFLTPSPAPAQKSDLPLEPLTTVQPDYTPEARQAGLQGSAVLYIEVTPAGQVDKVRPIQTLGLGLDQKAIEAVKQWRFKPGKARDERSAELKFLLNPAPSWRILRAAYQLAEHGKDKGGQFAEPVLSQYTAPDDQPCLAGGGTVLVEVQIDRQGKPGLAQIMEEHGDGSGHAVFQAAAKWRFQSGIFNGKAGKFKGTFELDCSASSPQSERAIYRVGGAVTPPVPTYRPEPYYSEEARKAKYQGTVVIALYVDPTGHAINMRVIRSLGLGLDERAMEAINRWRFKPGMKSGQPVTVAAAIEVNFRLL